MISKRLLKKEKLKDLYGAWKDYPELDAIFKEISKRRIRNLRLSKKTKK